MRIHSDTLTHNDLYQAMREIPQGEVWLHTTTRHGSRKRDHAFEVQLRGCGDRHHRRPNTGTHGAAQGEYAATYDDWGWFLAQLFAKDEHLTCGYYDNVHVFHRITKHKFHLSPVVAG